MKRLLALGLLVALAAAGVAIHRLLYTPAGLQWTLRHLQTWIPGQLAIDRADGRLAGPLEIRGLHYENDTLAVAIDDLTLRWRPGRLVDGVLAVDALIVSGLDVTLKPAPPSARGEFDIRLPLAVELKRFSLARAALLRPGQDPVVIDAVEAGASADEGMVILSGLRLKSPHLNLDASGQLPLNQRDALRLALRWQASAQERIVAGDGDIGGTWRRLTTEMRIAQPLSMNVAAWLDIAGEPLRWGVRATADPFAPSGLLPQAPPGRAADATIEAEGTDTGLAGTGGFTWHDERYGSWTVALNADWDGTRWDFPRVDIKALDGTTRVSGRAQFQPGDGAAPPSFLVDARWQGLAWPPTRTGRPLSPAGTLRASGTLAAYDFEATGMLLPPGVPPLNLKLAGRGDGDHIDVERLNGNWLEGEWSGHGAFAWSPVPSWDFALLPRHVNPAALRQGFDGRLDADTRVRGAYVDDAVSLDIDVERLEGTLRGYPLSARTRVSYRPGETRVDDLQLNSGSATLALDARLGEELHLDWRLDAPALGELHPEFAGALRTQGRLDGPPSAPHARFEIDARQLAYGNIYAGSLQVRADVDTAPAGSWQVSAQAEDAGTPSLHRGRLTLDVAGGSEDHAVNLTAELDDYRIAQQARGSLRDRRWEAHLHDGQIDLAALGRFAQRDDSTLTIAPDTFALSPWCLRREAAALCLDGEGDPTAAVRANLDWRELDIAPLAALAPDADITLEGKSSGQADIALDAGALRSFSAELKLGAGTISYPLPTDTGQHHTVTYHEAGLAISGAGGEGLRADLHIAFEHGARIAAEAQLPQWDPATPAPAPEQPLAGRAEISLGDLDVISLFLPLLDPGPGRLQSRIELSGTLGDPVVDGQADLELSSLAVARLGINLQDLGLHARVERNRWKLQGELRSGDGRLTLEGSGSAEDIRRLETSFALKGDGVEILRLPAATIIASPDMTLKYTPGDLELSGTLSIPKAQLEPVMQGSGTGTSPDAVVVGGEQRVTTARTRVHGTIDLVLGDEVRIAAMGVKGRLTGHLRILMNGTDDINGQGEIRLVDSRFQAYGQDLAIERGVILFAGGPIDNPALDIVAARTREKDIEEIKVGVRVTGTAEQPVLTLFSDPAMDESDILSYLVVGRPLNEASASEGESLYKEAATSISLAGSETIAKHIGGKFGITEVNIESGDDTEDTALVLGKSLSPRLYIRYVQGLVDNTATFQIRYRLSDKWMLQTESGTSGDSAAGADLLYTFER